MEAFRIGRYVAAASPKIATEHLKAAVLASHVRRHADEVRDESRRPIIQRDGDERRAKQLSLEYVDPLFADPPNETAWDDRSDDEEPQDDSTL